MKLPDADITVVHRSDGSGTTFVWTDYLSKVSPEWKSKVGANTSVNWPVGLGGKGNEGVAGLVKQTPNSIGYVELIYAVQNKMAYGAVKNAAGEFVKADFDSVTEAAAGAQRHARRFPGFHHQRARQESVSHLELHLAADSRQDPETPPRRSSIRISEVDADRRPEVTRPVELRSAAQSRWSAKEEEADRSDKVRSPAWQRRSHRRAAPTGGAEIRETLRATVIRSRI